MQNKQEFFDALKKGSQTEVNEIVEKELRTRVAEELENIEESVAKNILSESKMYDKVFNAIADHMDLDPEDIDNVDDETKKEFFDMVDKCWDEDADEVTSACPIDINMSESVNESRRKTIDDIPKDSFVSMDDGDSKIEGRVVKNDGDEIQIAKNEPGSRKVTLGRTDIESMQDIQVE